MELYEYVDIILSYNEYNICIKDYWTWNNLSENMIKNYEIGSKNLNTKTNKKFFFILLKKNSLGVKKTYNNILDYKNRNSEFLYIIENNSVEKIIYNLSSMLY